MLRKEGIGTVFFGDEELVKGMAGQALQRFVPHLNGQLMARAHA